MNAFTQPFSIMGNFPRFGREYQRTRYCLGFAFNDRSTRIALVRKKREPVGSNMIGRLNGVGGEVRASETYVQAMRRQFLEETGIVVASWWPVAIVEGARYRLYVYGANVDVVKWRRIRTRGAEEIERHSARRLPPDVYPDVRWLVAFAQSGEPNVLRVDRREI